MGISLFGGGTQVKDAAERTAEAQEDQADAQYLQPGAPVESSAQANILFAHPQADPENEFDRYLKRESILKFIPKERFQLYNDLIEQYDSLIEDCHYYGYHDLAKVFHHSLTVLEGNLRTIDGFERQMQTTSTTRLFKTKAEGQVRPQSVFGEK